MSKSESELLAAIWTLYDFGLIRFYNQCPMYSYLHGLSFSTQSKYQIISFEKLQVLLHKEALIIKIDFKIKNWNWQCNVHYIIFINT